MKNIWKTKKRNIGEKKKPLEPSQNRNRESRNMPTRAGPYTCVATDKRRPTRWIGMALQSIPAIPKPQNFLKKNQSRKSSAKPFPIWRLKRGEWYVSPAATRTPCVAHTHRLPPFSIARILVPSGVALLHGPTKSERMNAWPCVSSFCSLICKSEWCKLQYKITICVFITNEIKKERILVTVRLVTTMFSHL